MNQSLTPDVHQVAEFHHRLDAAIADSAGIAWRIAPDRCFAGDRANDSCAAYHRIWQYLQMLGTTNSMRNDTAFLVAQFRKLRAEGRFDRVLISGTADYGTLARVFWADELDDERAEITVIDRCPTTIELNRWYAERCGRTIVTAVADALDYRDRGTFDAITTHSFLGWFSPEDRVRLLDRWARLLKPGGTIITNKRIRGGDDGGLINRFSEDAVSAFSETTYRRALDCAKSLAASPAELKEAAANYARSYARYQLCSEQELRDLFEHAGFSIRTLQCRERSAAVDDRPSGPARGAGSRLRIVAERV